MAFSRLVLTVLLVSVSCYAKNDVPVFIWGDQAKPIQTNPLETTTTSDFARLLAKAVPEDYLKVIFIEPALSPEDFSTKNEDGDSPFPYLKANSKHLSYLSAVESPVLALTEYAEPSAVDNIALTENGLSSEIESSNSKYLFISFNDAKEDETRFEMLRRHNDFMEDMFNKIQNKHKDVVAFYTALNPSWVTQSHSRMRRQAVASNETEDFILDGVRLYVELIELREGDNVFNFTNNPTSSMTVNDTLHTMNTTVNFGDHTFVMNFRTELGYWFFDSVTFNQGTANEEMLYPTTDMLHAIVGFSYRCGQTTVFNNLDTNTSRTLTFNDLQIQPYFTTINETVQFGDTFDCIGFFSGPIWAGLMVTFILLAITFYGIIMMMDIKTMDRFDDPKGKTITINAAE